MLGRFACFNVAVAFSAVNLLNYGVLIYLLWSSILFSTAVRAELVAKLVTLDILFLPSFILSLRAAVAAKFVKLCIP